ncbi:hypothetical protein [Mesorhizobium sp. M7D.F.Ca.US.004.01.2.1]|uniref:hypothetical protein n=1 Tax=Mesorhizobium sp. M7D.F.Ca.US.004.01.2.1 TaxID=2496738 RepID=UPI000FCA0D23|nr:hypothetical protein [Mesorhizobium sp. M7D.F.Ca.US.004.01.2.1]RUX95945.1 hypothetical protein EN993_09675 [Mesorhizobium sp. M7D.F.Ca.US.004.01.2.1]
MFNSVSKITKALNKMVDKLHAHAIKQEAKTERLAVDIEISTAAHERKVAAAIAAHEAHLTKLATKRLDAFGERDRALQVAEKVSALVG